MFLPLFLVVSVDVSNGMQLLLAPCVNGVENQTYSVMTVPPYVNPAAIKNGKG